MVIGLRTIGFFKFFEILNKNLPPEKAKMVEENVVKLKAN
jgi:hypothetical protein